MKRFSESRRENKNLQFIFNNFLSNVMPFMRKCRKILYSRTIWRMLIACWIPKATDPRSEYVILIAFPLQQWLFECALMLLNTLNAELNLTCHLLALLGAHRILHISGIKVNTNISSLVNNEDKLCIFSDRK